MRHPNAASLIVDTRGDCFRLAVFDSETRTLVDTGWHEIGGFVGWTVYPYDWERKTGRTP